MPEMVEEYPLDIMRDVKESKPNKGEGLFRTMSMAMIIAAVMCFVAMFFPLYKNVPAGADLLTYYLPWCLAYGIVNLAIAGLGTFFTTVSKDKPSLYFPGFIVGIVVGALLFGEGLPIGIVLGHVEFCISVIVIGACVIAISCVGISSLKDKD